MVQVDAIQVFLPDDKLFGEYNEQHPMGQKLMTYFDDDPQKADEV